MSWPDTLPPRGYLLECFHYDPESGRLVWRRRPLRHFSGTIGANRWNGAMPGKTIATRDDYGYLVCNLTCDGVQRRLRVHRVAYKIMTDEEPPEIDHRDNVKSNNRWSNLRKADRSQNNCNTRRQRGRLLPKGVSESRGLYLAQITARGQHHFLGRHGTVSAAKRAYAEAGRKLHGDFFNDGQTHEH